MLHTPLIPAVWKTFEMLQSVVELHPRMFRLLEDGHGRRRVGRVGKRANPHTDPGRRTIGLPIDGRTAGRAKIHMNLAAAIGSTNEFGRRPAYFDTIDRIERIGAERCARSSLTRETVTQRRQ